ncbi:hypothetical protein [Bacillus chungangensis]|uniref:Uncharacterized protein n=1 Tax=Bacillus chungangensis TaxID=587633 RepID=A0ABT9WMF8_9BACI|nr:hypothetical protein [Bacillus chungangensis]MDQ0174458.1 hypothetical protein [Bacillus chungangensis]
MYRPTVTTDVADSLAYVETQGIMEDVIRKKAEGYKYKGNPSLMPLNKIDLQTLMAAMVNGYEIEKTPEEKLLAYYKNMWMCEDDSGTMYSLGVCEGIRNTLEILGITVEGISTQDYGF